MAYNSETVPMAVLCFLMMYTVMEVGARNGSTNIAVALTFAPCEDRLHMCQFLNEDEALLAKEVTPPLFMGHPVVINNNTSV